MKIMAIYEINMSDLTRLKKCFDERRAVEKWKR
jgi:hypothetical protein